MLSLERILVPIDFSDASRAAINQAVSLAGHFQSRLTLLHVNESTVFHPLAGPLGFGVAPREVLSAEHLAARRKLLDEFCANELGGVAVKRLVCNGDPARLIAERASQEKSDLILMPTHGVGLFRRFLLGSVTAKILHDVNCPVWTGAHLVDTQALVPAKVRHVMCAVNFGPLTLKAVRWAADFAAEFRAKLTIVHAVLDTPPNLPERYMFQWHEEARQGAEERFRTLLLDAKIHADRLLVSDGDIPGAISAAVVENRAELLVIARRGGGDVPKRLGPHTYGIVCSAPCPVISV